MRVRFGAVLLLAACATATSFDRDYEAGRYAEALQTFDADSTLRWQEEPLFRAAAMRAAPGESTYDVAGAHALLTEFLQRYPETSHRREAVLLLGLTGEISQQEAQLRQIDAEAERLRARVVELERLVAADSVEADRRNAALQAMTDTLRSREEELKTLREELDHLKAVDLRPSRSAPAPSPLPKDSAPPR